jgi:thioredoxin-related protein
MRRLLLTLVAIALCSRATAIAGEEPAIEWRPWSDSVFTEAKNDHRFVLLDLGTVWCHVMDEVTYQDPEVIKLARERYIAVRVDADARPDLSNRYEDYGWPATIVFNAEGGELVKRRGYLPPRQMASMLQAIIDDPTPGPSVVQDAPFAAGTESTLADNTRNELRRILIESYDPKNGGWGTIPLQRRSSPLP